jgi:hypothetical protein
MVLKGLLVLQGQLAQQGSTVQLDLLVLQVPVLQAQKVQRDHRAQPARKVLLVKLV